MVPHSSNSRETRGKEIADNGNVKKVNDNSFKENPNHARVSMRSRQHPTA